MAQTLIYWTPKSRFSTPCSSASYLLNAQCQSKLEWLLVLEEDMTRTGGTNLTFHFTAVNFKKRESWGCLHGLLHAMCLRFRGLISRIKLIVSQRFYLSSETDGKVNSNWGFLIPKVLIQGFGHQTECPHH